MFNRTSSWVCNRYKFCNYLTLNYIFKNKNDSNGKQGGPRMVKTIPKKRVLSVLIRLKRNDMYMKAKRFGLSHPIVVAHSQELDTLLNRYQGIRTIQ